MKGVRVLIALLLCALVAVAANGGGVVAQDDDAQATIDALETEVSRLETRVATYEPTAEATPAGDTADQVIEAPKTTLYGSIPREIPRAKRGEFAVVATSQPIEGTLAVVLQNRTGEAVYFTNLNATARDANGKLVATADYGRTAPYVVPAGGFAVATANFSGSDLTDGLTYEFDPEYDTSEPRFGSSVDLAITEAELTEDGIVGTVANSTSDETASGAGITGVCFAADGIIAGYFSGYGARDELAPDADTSFDAMFYYPGIFDFNNQQSAAATCASILVGATAYSF